MSRQPTSKVRLNFPTRPASQPILILPQNLKSSPSIFNSETFAQMLQWPRFMTELSLKSENSRRRERKERFVLEAIAREILWLTLWRIRENRLYLANETGKGEGLVEISLVLDLE